MMQINESYAATPELAKSLKTAKSEEQKLREACQGFEAMLTHKMLQSMRSATESMDSGLIKKSNGEKIFTDMLDEEMANMMSRNTVNGLADMMFEQLKSTVLGADPKKMPPAKSLHDYMPKAQQQERIDMLS